MVGLTIDENGIPATSGKGRVEIAGKIIREAEKYGIDKKDIVIDVLAMTISSEPEGQEYAGCIKTGAKAVWGPYRSWSIQYFLWVSPIVRQSIPISIHLLCTMV